jgi:hypothetical protein
MSIRPLNAKATAQAVEDLAAQFARPLSEVREMLNDHVDQLDRSARIKEYVPLIAVKQVKEMLRTNWGADHRMTPRALERKIVV